MMPAKRFPCTLYQDSSSLLHRTAQVKADDKALVIGASGGGGTALIELGAVPIDCRAQDFVEVIRQAGPEVLDVVLDGMGGGCKSR